MKAVGFCINRDGNSTFNSLILAKVGGKVEIKSYSYRKKGSMEFIYDKFAHSRVILYPIKNYYFIKFVKWNSKDPYVTRQDLEEMEELANEEMGTLEFYMQRKGSTLA